MSTLKNPIIQYIKDVIQFSIDEETSILNSFSNHKWITYNNSTLEYKVPDHYAINVTAPQALYFIAPAGTPTLNLANVYSAITFGAPLSYELQCSDNNIYQIMHDLPKTNGTGTINNSFSKNTSSFFNLMQSKFWEYPLVTGSTPYPYGLSEFGTMDKDSCLKELTEYILTLPSLDNNEGTLQFVLEAFMTTGFASYTNDGITVYAGTGQGFANWW